MPASPEGSPPARRYRLETLGSLTLVDAVTDRPLPEQGAQRRRLALLAVLAAAGDRGRSRDHLMALLWPEAPTERARHSLVQLVYGIRTWLGEDVFTGVNPVALNRTVLDSDLAQFLDALDAGEDERAVATYRGPFLHGFFLSETAEFDRWMEGERARWEARYAQALERLARRAEDAVAWDQAAGWWRRLTELDPLSGRYAVGLMRSLAGGGDRGAALRHAERHREVVARELEADPEPEVTAFAGELRAAPRPAPHAAPAPPAVTSVTPSAPAVPPGRREEPPGSAAAPPVVASRRALVRGLILVAGVTLGGFSVWMARSRARSPAPSAPVLAVLPLVTPGGSPADVALGDGLTEELIAALGKLPDLRVIASTSVFALKGRSLDVRRVADTLGATTVLEGSVQHVGGRLRVHLRLIDATDGATRWSDTYDRGLGDFIAVQDAIAAAVARELEIRLGGRSTTNLLRHGTRSAAAYERYLRGRDPSLLRSDSGARLGIEHFSAAIGLDSGFAAAYAGLAHMYAVLGLGGRPGIPFPELKARAEAAARRAVALDDSLPEAHLELAFVQMVGLSDLPDAETHFARAHALDPRVPRGHEYLATLYALTGRPAQALAEARVALELDPLSAAAAVGVARMLALNDRCPEALDQLAALGPVTPPPRRARQIAAWCHAELGRPDTAAALLRPDVERGDLRATGLLGLVLARGGRSADARAVLARLQAEHRATGLAAFDIAVVHAGLGEIGEAVVWLERAPPYGGLWPELLSPTFRALHAHPRFNQLRRRLGLQNR